MVRNLSSKHSPDLPSAEAFMPLDQTKRMLFRTLQGAGRIDSEGVVQPIEVQRQPNRGGKS